jgi:hypothetical protein
MKLLEKIQAWPHPKKIKLVWALCLFAALFLVAVWIVTSRIGKTDPADTSFFHNFRQSILNIKRDWNK